MKDLENGNFELNGLELFFLPFIFGIMGIVIGYLLFN